MTQQGDVLMFQRNDGGDIEVEAGITAMSGGLETAVYLSLFGGNEDDDGTQDSPRQWWGNFSEISERRYRSETGNLLQALPAIPANLRRVEEAAARDLAWMKATGAARGVVITTSIPALNQIRVRVDIDGNLTLEYVENWTADL